jgi:starvation-inducible DNA-binding protein
MKNVQISKRLATPNSLGDQACKAISAAINPLVADAFALYVKTKNYHWHMSGPHYRDYHLMFDEQADQIFEMVDVLAERIRKLGGITIHSISEISKLQNVQDDNELFVEPVDMLQRLCEENKKYADRMRDAHKVCEKYGDIATTSILETLIDETERRTWFLYESYVK